MKTADSPVGKAATTTSHLLLVSADCHGGAPVPEYRQYLERRYWADFDDYLATRVDRFEAFFTAEAHEGFNAQEALLSGGHSGAWDPERRLRELEVDGIVADVIFPDGEYNNEPPFFGGSEGVGSHQYPRELEWAGMRAYNRWLAEFCSINPDRHAGVILIPIHDIGAAVKEIEWASSAGLRGGVMLPSATRELPLYHDDRYEPLWSACEAHGMPVNVHAGDTGVDYGTGPLATILLASEIGWFAHRPMWFLLWSGVFERHPGLTFILTEQLCDWVPDTLSFLDWLYEGPLFGGLRRGTLTMKPSEYWARQCFVGASFMARRECERRHAVGIGNIMWGSDYPHVEGTWPHTRQSLSNTFAGVPPEELQAMLGLNAVRAYGFDVEKLAPVTARVGPTVDELLAPLDEAPADTLSPAWREQ